MKENPAIFKDLTETFAAMNLPVSHMLHDGDGFSLSNLKDLFKVLPFKSIVFRPNYFTMLFVKDAHADYTTDNITFAMEPGTIFFTNPGHYRSFEWFDMNDVYLVAFTEAFLKKNIHGDVFQEFPFLVSETVNPRTLAPDEFAHFEDSCLQLFKAFESNSIYKQKIIGNYLMILLFKIKEAFWKDYNPIYEGNKSSQIVKNFKASLENHFRDLVEGKTEIQFRVTDYAEIQSLHENYLNTVIKTKTGKSVRVWISEKMITEAQSLLLHTSLSNKEISIKLGFIESAHFGNYFKKHTGLTPLAYRQAYS
ncbi:AraC family transcriptional regulator [Flavobacterium sp. MDT1-60]|uniref:helix-turn-helix domain-containing protein n=1 Tax=Flavobacterium sp. MDT1-60 TaxID=1979344 RepID=UPI001783ED38|nr:helix-turn-helix domain-containing protein [Flavobacterium sp. MDT1-60]QOG01588.1 AraC family transcriptional regulator [Flavobacterium sp. MDT1-60]